MDEDSSDGDVIAALRRAGHDPLSAFDAGRIGLADEDQLSFAARESRILYSANQGDFMRIHASWMMVGRDHAGILIRSNQTMGVGEQVCAFQAFSGAGIATTNMVAFLANWL